VKTLPARLPRSTVIDRPLYTITLEHHTIEDLADGRCPEALAQEAHRLLRWQRAAMRVTTKTTTTTPTTTTRKKKKFVGRA
jgi:hypothetical protein